MYNFDRKVNSYNVDNMSILEMETSLTTEDRDRLEKYRTYWNFYEGYHWEGLGESDKPQITENYCRRFVDKFVSFELGAGFTISVPFEQEDAEKTETPINDFLDEIWNDNKRDALCIELGQSKSITGDAWVQVRYERPEQIVDPYGEYPDGRIRVEVIPTNIIFPLYDSHDKDKLIQVTVSYPIDVYEKQGKIFTKRTKTKKIFKQVWTEKTVVEYLGNEETKTFPNPYGIIPFVQIKNVPLVGRNQGVSDLEDIIPLNMELNFKKSDISEIIDYHSSPVTIIYGAKVSALEKGANKVWGGLPKDARVQNLEMNSDLGASVGYISQLKTALHEIGCIPEGALGGNQAISNTSGVALQFVNMPLIERTRIKRMNTEEGIRKINKMILLIGLTEELISVPEGVQPKEFFNTEITFTDTLPKDRLIELQQIQLELQLGLESKQGAMRRLNKENITYLLEEIEQERLEEEAKMLELQQKQSVMNAETQMMASAVQSKLGASQTPKLNSGMTNGETPVEQVRKETTGSNGMSNE